jgi:hypothetical protein
MTRFYYAAVCLFMIAAAMSPAAAFATPELAAQEPAAAVKMASDAEPAPSALTGKVAETMSSGGYTYILLEKADKKIWVAVPQMKVVVGQEISLVPGAEMGKFTSKSLNKTFDNIIFSAGPVKPKGPSAAPASGPGEGPRVSGGSKAASLAPEKDVKVEKAEGPNAYTIADVFAQREKLDKKTAVVRGKVVKISEGIMGSNWIHLQDGTGDAAKKTHDLVVTTQDLPKVGDVVTVKGTVAKDKDFGAGYNYKVLIEKANVTH